MESKVGYLCYKEDGDKNFFKKFYNTLFYKAEYCSINDFKSKIIINKDIIDNKILKKVVEIKNKNNIKNIVVSNKIKFNENIKELNVLTGKFLMKNSIIFLLEFLFKLMNKDLRCENLYILIDNDKNKDIIIDLANNFKSISIVTDNIKRLRRLDRKLNSNDELIISISNNYKKALRKANVIVNFDYDISFFEKFNVNRNSIIINLYSEKLNLKNSYQGMVIENIEIDFDNIDDCFINNIQDFNKTIFYESYILNSNYFEIKDKYNENNCKIKNFIGVNGKINVSEVKKFL